MASSGNFPLWSPLMKGATNLSAGNTRFTGATNSKSAATTFVPPTGTKFYVECLVVQATNYNIVFGLVGVDQAIDTYLESQGTVNGMIFHGYSGSEWRTQAVVNGSRQGFSGNVGMSTNRVLGMTINTVDNEIKMYLDNTLIGNGTISISATQKYRIFCSFTGGTASGVHMNINCGHDSTGAGDFSAASNADENGFGEFQYSPPSGFLAPSSANLPISDDIDPAQTDDDFPQKQFNAITWTGNRSSNSTTNAITGVGFQPDLVWLKFREQTYDWRLVDSSRGVTEALRSNQTTVEQTEANGLFQFDSDGFTVRGDNNYNYNGGAFIGYCWRANGGTTASNSQGSITATVQANQAAGFSIVTYTGNDGAWGSGNRDTFGHGLSAAPEFIIVKERDNTDAWTVFHAYVGNGGGSNAAANNLRLDTSEALYTNQSYKSFGETMPTSTLVTVEGNTTNNSSNTHVAYCWHSVEGYSKFGSYEGNDNTDGPFIYTGFRPRMVCIKGVDEAYSWFVFDAARNPTNLVDKHLRWDQTEAELTEPTGARRLDFFSNGFKIRASAASLNGNNDTYVFMAWGDVPFKYNNTF